jgi:hypothetical protein
MFKPLASRYSNKVTGFTERSYSLTSISKRDFFFLFYPDWQASFREKTILKAFKATGLSSFNSEVMLKRFNTSPNSSNSKSSVLSVSDWKKIRQLVDCIVNNRNQKKTSRLNQTIHHLSVRATLAEHEVEGLQEALVNERTRRNKTNLSY